MMTLLKHTKWQLVLLQKNSIISISVVVTLIYCTILFFLRDIRGLDKVLVALILNDPSVIGYFFIALGIYSEIKYGVLSALLVSPQSIHYYLLSRVLSISVIGTACSLGLVFSVKGLGFDWWDYTVGSAGICLLSAMLGVVILTYASNFLNFAMLSVPVFLVFINAPMFQYLGAVDMGIIVSVFPIQGCLDLIDHSLSGHTINYWYCYLSLSVLLPVFYWAAFTRFSKYCNSLMLGS